MAMVVMVEMVVLEEMVVMAAMVVTAVPEAVEADFPLPQVPLRVRQLPPPRIRRCLLQPRARRLLQPRAPQHLQPQYPQHLQPQAPPHLRGQVLPVHLLRLVPPERLEQHRLQVRRHLGQVLQQVQPGFPRLLQRRQVLALNLALLPWLPHLLLRVVVQLLPRRVRPLPRLLILRQVRPPHLLLFPRQVRLLLQVGLRPL